MQHLKKGILDSKITLSVALVSMLAGIALGAFFHKETVVVREGTADTPAAMTSVNLMVDDGARVRTWNTVSWHETMSAINLLEAVSRVGEIELLTTTDKKRGLIVAAIDGVASDETLNMHWRFWVNNVYEPREASRYYLKPGDIVVWKYTEDPLN